MSIKLADKAPKVQGRIALWDIIYPQTGGQIITPRRPPRPNQIQYAWGYIAAQTIGLGNRSYRVSGMYIEFENMGDPDDPVTVPSFGRDEGTEYYDDLQSSGVKDFLRVPLITNPAIGIESGFEAFFTPDETGNKLTFFAQSQGATGIHGKTFSHLTNSKVYGVALVAMPTFADRTKDVVFARSYFDPSEQAVKEASAQLGIVWDVAFE